MKGCLHLQVDAECLDHTLAFRNLCREQVAPKLQFLLVFSNLVTLTFGPPIFRNATLLQCFRLTKLQPGPLK